MHSSRLNSKGAESQAAVSRLVASRVGRQWCLFLDRDGVINRQIVGDYVRHWQQFDWLPSASEALKLLRRWAPRLVIVTNQQGIGKGLMTSCDVAVIHDCIQKEIAADGGPVIDAFQVCPHLESAACSCRKPQPGLVLDWLQKHTDVDPSLSVMVGDSTSDLELAQNIAAEVGGCAAIKIGISDRGARVDASFDSLFEFATVVEHARKEQRG